MITAPSSKTIIPTHTDGTVYQGCNNGFKLNTPPVYGRTGVSLYPDKPVPHVLTCQNSAPGVQFGVTSIQSTPLQWKAGDAGTPIVSGKISWTLQPQQISYGPNIVLSSMLSSILKKGVAQTRLGWAVKPFNPADPVSCSSIPGGWGPNAQGSPAVGFSRMATSLTQTYVPTCAEAGLITLASITVAAYPGH